jgi:DNA-binding HxlR family transcriptional regulator
MTEPRCSIARTLEVIGEKWTILVVREAFWGTTRFSDFRTKLEMASDVLTARLTTLVEHGVMEKRAYRENGSRERFSYHLTPSGRELHTVLAALNEWGDRHRPHELGPVRHWESVHDNSVVHLAFVTSTGEILPTSDVEVVRGTAQPVSS